MALLKVREELKNSFKSGNKRDLDTMIQAMVNTAVLNKIDVKKYTKDEIINFTKKYSKQINDEFKVLDKKRIEKEMQNTKKNYK